jgi:integrase
MVDPVERMATAGRTLTVDELMGLWLATKAALPGLKTADNVATDYREVLRTFSGQLAAQVLPSEVRVWTARDRGQSLRRRSLLALRQAYRLAIADGMLKSDPTMGVPLPKPAQPDLRFLSWNELRRLAVEAGDDPLIWLLGTVGLRLGEACGLQVDDVRANRIRVSRQITLSSQGAVQGAPKHGRSRDVPVPAFVLNMLPLEGRVGSEWLFSNRSGGPFDSHNWRARVFKPAAARAGFPGMHPHELRHTAASLAIQSGADVKVVQRMLGHASATLTLDLYGHLFDSALDDVSARMDAAHAATFGALQAVPPVADAG